MESKSSEHHPSEIIPFSTKLDDIVWVVNGLSVLQQFVLPPGCWLSQIRFSYNNPWCQESTS